MREQHGWAGFWRTVDNLEKKHLAELARVRDALKELRGFSALKVDRDTCMWRCKARRRGQEQRETIRAMSGEKLLELAGAIRAEEAAEFAEVEKAAQALGGTELKATMTGRWRCIFRPARGGADPRARHQRRGVALSAEGGARS